MIAVTSQVANATPQPILVVGASSLLVNKPVLDAQQTLFTLTWQAGKKPARE